MTLTPHPKVKGLFLDRSLQDKPGTFAVVIGVSAYKYLDGGDEKDRANNNFNLGQLAVSALTAHRFFDWMRSQYSFEEAPLSKCWVLASPTTAEVAVEPALAEYPDATFENCAKSIVAWHNAIQSLHPDYVAKSRAIFFFSGHGIERGSNRQILLPSDYLEPPAELVDQAMSTSNLYAGFRRLPLKVDFYFVDACRALPVELAGVDIVGARILKEYSSFQGVSSRVSPIVYATGSGGETWQPKSAQDGISHFGTALVEGLKREACRRPQCTHPTQHISLDLLTQYVSARLTELLDDANSDGLGPVRTGGESTDVCVTSLISPIRAAPRPTPRPKGKNTRGGFVPELDAIENSDDPTLQPQLRESLPRPVHRTRETLRVPPGLEAVSENTEAIHDLLGHESLTEMWVNARISALSGTAPRIVIRSVERFTRSGIRVGFELSPTQQCWIEFPSFSVAYCCELPGSSGKEKQILFDAELTSDDIGKPLSFEVSLSENNQGWLGDSARMWQKYSQMRLDDALDQFDASSFESMLRQKVSSPVAAAVAGVFLLRSHNHDRLHDWLRNLSDWFPHLPDGPVLWAQQLRQTRQWGEAQEPKEVVEQLLRLEERGLPMLSSTFEYALEIATELCDFTYANDHKLTNAQEGRAYRIKRLRDRLATASAFARPGGLFQVFTSAPGSLDSTLVRAEGAYV